MRANVLASAIFTLEAEREQEMGQFLLSAFRSSQIIFVFTLRFWTKSAFEHARFSTCSKILFKIHWLYLTTLLQKYCKSTVVTTTTSFGVCSSQHSHFKIQETNKHRPLLLRQSTQLKKKKPLPPHVLQCYTSLLLICLS